MFAVRSKVTIAADNYCDVIDYTINQITRKQSIASYNYAQKTMFFSHINKVVEEPMTPEFKLIELMVVNSLGEVYTVVCDDNTEIAVSRGRYTSYTKIKDLRTSSSILLDTKGFLCRIVYIKPYYDHEFHVYDVKSNKGSNKFVNGIMFKA